MLIVKSTIVKSGFHFIDIFRSALGIAGIEYLVSVSTHPYFAEMEKKALLRPLKGTTESRVCFEKAQGDIIAR